MINVHAFNGDKLVDVWLADTYLGNSLGAGRLGHSNTLGHEGGRLGDSGRHRGREVDFKGVCKERRA